MEEQRTAEEEQKIWSLMLDEMLFGLAGKPRKWEDWQLPPLQERRMGILNDLVKSIKICREKKDRMGCKFILPLARHFKLLETEPLEIQELYLHVFAMLSIKYENLNGFSNLISNPMLFEDHIFWRQIAVDNFSLQIEFQNHNLNW